VDVARDTPRPSRLVEVLLYPCSAWGLLIVALTVGEVLALRFVGRLGMTGGRLYVIVVLAAFYLYGALADCVENSAYGGTRAPKPLDDMSDPSEVWSHAVNLVTVFLICICPVGIYHLVTRRADTAFWILALWAVLTFPIALLAVVVLDSLDALNPAALWRSLTRTFLHYILVVSLFAVSAAVAWHTWQDLRDSASLTWLAVVRVVAVAYGFIILAHALGRFSRHNEERLDWNI
jgi:hypothetical protein